MLANCAIETQPRSLTVGAIDFYVQHYIFPVQFIFGVLGNCINLVVLLSSGMKNQANILLSAMALADLGFLFCMLPHSLVSFSFFYSSVRFSYFYFVTKTHAVALANMFSTAATFLVLAVSLERFSGVRRPMHTRFQLRDTRIFGFILGVFALSFALSFYHHVEYYVNVAVECSNVLATFKHISQGANSSKALVSYVAHAKYIQSIFGVVLPVIAVAILNVSLICILRKREILPRHVADRAQHNEFRYSDLGALQRQERKVTATVIAIITCFTVTHLPTLIPFIWEQVYSYSGMKPTGAFNNVITLLNMLLVSGKVLNFVLFCSSSAHFRRRTVTILNAYLCPGRYRKKYSSMISAPTGGITIMLPLFFKPKAPKDIAQEQVQQQQLRQGCTNTVRGSKDQSGSKSSDSSQSDRSMKNTRSQERKKDSNETKTVKIDDISPTLSYQFRRYKLVGSPIESSTSIVPNTPSSAPNIHLLTLTGTTVIID